MKAHDEGYDAFYDDLKNGKDIESGQQNPYEPGSSKANQWERGYLQADIYESGDTR